MPAVLCKCGKSYQVDEAYAGRTVRCRRCGGTLSVPGSHAAETLPSVNSGAVASDPGEFLDQVRYGFVRDLAKGGQGKISIARDLALKRDVALKELLKGVADVPASLRRFVAEAEITGQLEHPGIVPIYALGADKHGKPFYAMRLVAGQTLKEAIDEYHKSPRPAELKALLRRFVMVCETVAFAHNRGVIHRDLKPANIMLGRFGETLVMDWGLAKPLRDGESDESTLGAVADRQLADRPDLTATDAVVGTPAYMPPEQALGKANEVGIEADIYSLGAVLYHVLTGTPPYSGGSSLEVLKQVATEPPPKPSEVYRNVPRALEAICLKAMARRHKARYRTAAELAHSVQRWLDDEPVDAYKEPRLERIYRWSRKHRAAVSSGAIALAVVFVVGCVAIVVVQRYRDKATVMERIADDYQRQAHAAQIRAEEKEAEADRLAKQAEASRREATEAVQSEALARQAADEANKQIAEIEAARAGESEELTKKRSELADAQKRMEEESKRAEAATDRALELERQVVALRREAEEYRDLTLKLTRLAAEVDNPRQAPSVEENTPWSDFADRDPASFDVLASDNSAGTAAADTEREHTGRQSLRVSTANGGGVCVTYPKDRNANWDLSPYDYVNFAFSLGDAGVRYRDKGLSVRIGRGSQSIEYRAKKPEEALSLAPRGWAYVRIPLWGDSVWEKREVNPLSLSHVDWIEVHISTLSPKLTVWLDDLYFGDSRQADPPLLPDPDRTAAEYVAATNGEAQAWISGKTVTMRTLTDIPSEPFKITSIIYSRANGVTDVGLKLFGTLTDCRWLSLYLARITDDGLEHLKHMYSLERLNLGMTQIRGSGLKHLAELPKLEYLGLPSTTVTEEALRNASKLHSLAELDMSSARFASSGLKHLADHPMLAHLNVNNTTLNDEAVVHIAAMPKLTHADVGNTQVTDKGITRLSSARLLTEIEVWGSTRISVEGLRHLKDLPSGLQRLALETINAPSGLAPLQGTPLRNLTISATPTKGHIEDSFLESLRCFPDLSELYVGWAIIDERVMKHISAIAGLQKLILAPTNTATFGRGLSHLAEASKLEGLFISGPTIREPDALSLGALSKLKTLDLQSTKIDPASVLKLRAALPNCKITVDEAIQKAIDELRGKK